MSVIQPPSVRWRLHGVSIDILYPITDYNLPRQRLLGFHIREIATGIERDIFWDDNGEIDGFEYETTSQ